MVRLTNIYGSCEACNSPVAGRDPGADGVVGNADDVASIRRYDDRHPHPESTAQDALGLSAAAGPDVRGQRRAAGRICSVTGRSATTAFMDVDARSGSSADVPAHHRESSLPHAV